MLRKRKTVEDGASRRVSRKPAFEPVNISESGGIRYLHFGTPWVQGAMRIRRPDWIELEYAQQMMAWMLFLDRPAHIVQLGLGTGALTKFCYREIPEAQVTAVELNPTVIAVCRSMFALPPGDERLHVVEMDAMDFIADPARRRTIDVLQVDLYDASARGPVLDTPEFYLACAASLAPHGIMAVNLFGDHPSYEKNLDAMRPAFDQILCLPEVDAGNVVAFGFRQPPALDDKALDERALKISHETGLPAPSWVNGLRTTAESTVKSTAKGEGR